MSFLVPLFFAGVVLLVVPWLVHRIRRPERERVRFSSLMFVPDIKREVIERRRVQHILLMVLRMMLLALLVFAFARPFQEVLLGADVSSEEGTHHVILLDASLSMGANDIWEEAKRQAIAVLDEVKAGDQVGVIRFGQSALVDMPLSEDVSLARQAVMGADWTWEKGNSLVGLQASADMLTGKQDVRRVVHLVSDFQATGLPTIETGWALPGHMRLHPVVIGDGSWTNVSVDALALRSVGQQTLQVRARVKNWQGTEALNVRLWLDGEVMDAKTFSVVQGHASQVRFDVPERALQGFVAVGGSDGLVGDNRQFFTYQPAPKHRVLVLQSGSLHGLMLAAVPDVSDLPWQMGIAEAMDLVPALNDKPKVVVVGNMHSEILTGLRNYVQAGGNLFLPLEKGADAQLLNQLLEGSGIQVEAPKSEKQQVPLAWVDLKHRIFYPFRGAKFNDFSSIRYTGYHQLKVDTGTVLARFEGDDVIMAEAQLGQGRVLVWAGGLALDRSNLARSPRFVPLIHETLRYLSGEEVDPPLFFVGDIVGTGQIDKPGVHTTENGREVAVNVDGAESDPRQVTPAEFEIRMCEAPVLYRAGEAEAASVVGGNLIKEEYGYWILMVMFGALLLEHCYAAWLESHPKQEQV
jgi:hypothetical protein